MDLIQTPIEIHAIGDRKIHVKRDDLVGDGVIFPRWAKIEGIRRILESDAIDRNRPLTHLSVYGSWTGWVLSRLCMELGMEFISAYPDSRSYPEKILEIIDGNGAILYPMKPNMMKILDNKLRGVAKQKGWQILPYAFNHPSYIKYMQSRMHEVLMQSNYDHLVVSMGSGVTSSGLIREFLQYSSWKDILQNKRQVHSVTMSSIKSTQKILNENLAGDMNNIHIYTSEFAFDDMMDDVMDYPFDLNEFWDRKTWYWLSQNVDSLDGEILFWNIGGSYRNSLELC